MKNQRYMEGESRNLEKDPKRKPGDLVHDDCPIFQPIRIRHSSVLADQNDWKFVESELRFVLRCGLLFWALYLIYEAIK